MDKSDIPDDFLVNLCPDGEVKALPFRLSPEISALQQTYFSKFGIAEAPKTLEALIADAKKTTFTREDGAKVYGLGVKPMKRPMTFIKAAGRRHHWPEFHGAHQQTRSGVRISLPPAISTRRGHSSPTISR